MAKFEYSNREPTVRERLLIPPALQGDLPSQVVLCTLRRLDAECADNKDYWPMLYDEFFNELLAMDRGIREWRSTYALMGEMELQADALTKLPESNESPTTEPADVQDGNV